MPASPEERKLEQFLSQQPSWLQKILQGDYTLTHEEQAAMLRVNWPVEYGEAQDRYIELLRRCPKGLYAKYRKRATKDALAHLPKPTLGAPRKDGLRLEAKALLREGRNLPQVVNFLKQKYGAKVATPDALRHLIKPSKSRSKRRRK